VAGNIGPGAYRDDAIAMSEIEKLGLDRGRHHSYQVMVPGAAENLAPEKSGPVNAEEHAAHSTGAHGFDIDALRQNGHLSPADQGGIARLFQHCLTHREQHDHYTHADREPQQEE
jgi:hypothetical protein